jgi:hypothetical protein
VYASLEFGTLLQVLRVDLDNMPIGIADVDLGESGRGTRLQDHAVRIVNTGILAVAFRAEEMDVTRVERLLAKSGTVVNDQVKLLGIAHAKPRAWKIERRPRNLFDRQDLTVEPSRPIQVGYGERDVVNSSDFHTR